MYKDYDEVKKAAIIALALIDPNKPYGPELFYAIAGVSVTVCIEAVCLRRNPDTDGVEVWLIERAQDDPAYPGQMHCPGTVMRPGESIEQMFERLARAEFAAGLKGQTFVGFNNAPDEARGHFFQLIYLVQMESPQKGGWYPVDGLPPNIVENHRDILIPMAMKAFKG